MNDNKQLLVRWFEEVWNKGRADAIDEMFPANGIAHGLGPGGSDVVGPAAFKRFHESFHGAFPDIHIALEEIIAEGDLVAARFSAAATHRGDHLGVAATGRPVQFTGMTMIRCRNGQVIEGWNNVEFMSVFQTIGLLPPLPASQ